MDGACIKFVEDQILLVYPLQEVAVDNVWENFLERLQRIWFESNDNGRKFIFVFDSLNFEPTLVQIYKLAKCFIDMSDITNEILIGTYLIYPEKYRSYLDIFFTIYSPKRPLYYVSSREDALDLARRTLEENKE